jgi:hypothetical protein
MGARPGGKLRAPSPFGESGRGGTRLRGEDPRSVHDEAERATEPKVPAKGSLSAALRHEPK